jgi:hypothetical protein
VKANNYFAAVEEISFQNFGKKFPSDFCCFRYVMPDTLIAGEKDGQRCERI